MLGHAAGLLRRFQERYPEIVLDLFVSDAVIGMVWINSYKRVNPGSPFGGTGASGYGCEMGFEAMREYTQVKSVWVNIDAQIPPWYAR